MYENITGVSTPRTHARTTLTETENEGSRSRTRGRAQYCPGVILGELGHGGSRDRKEVGLPCCTHDTP